ncbi:MAG TPA: LuxR C-terminal-related transcriptional regulator [Novosphingobium sp.]|nr:LuxR C-terminal-related transcriptional regulator [Novosphingobium sp.]
MERISNLILIDSDIRRRAAISHALSNGRLHVEPFESVSELAAPWPRADVLLIQEEPGAVRKLIGKMAQQGACFPIVAFDEAPSSHQIVEAVLDGAIDYLTWPIPADELRAALERAVARSDKSGHGKLRELIARARIDRLTRRERQVLGGVASGLSNRLIGEQLAISPRTVEIHRANMLNKLGAHHTSDAIRIAIEAALKD